MAEPAVLARPSLAVSTLGNRATEAFYARLRGDDAALPEPQAWAGIADAPASAAAPHRDRVPEPTMTPDPPHVAIPAPDNPKHAADPVADPAADPDVIAADFEPGGKDAPTPDAAPAADKAAVAKPENIPAAAAETVSAAPGPDAASTPGPEFAVWRSQTMAAARGIKVPSPPDGATLSADTAAQGAKLSGSRSARRATAIKDVDAAVPPTPKSDAVPVKPPPEPVPQASAMVESLAARKLTDQIMPDLQASPRGTLTLVRDPAAKQPDPPANSPDTTTQSTPADASQLKSGPATPAPEVNACINDIQQSVAAPVPDLPPGTAVGSMLTDVAPPPRAPLPPLGTSIMKDVIARLLVNPAAQAAPILNAARDEAYPNGVLTSVYSDIGSDKLDGVIEALSTQLRRVAADAGVTTAEMDAAVTAKREELQKASVATHGELNKGLKDGEDAVCRAGKEEEGEVNAALDGRNAKTQGIVASSTDADSPVMINLRRDQQIGRINRRVGQIRFDYEQIKRRRLTALERAQRLQEIAYDDTAKQDQATVDRAASKATVFQDMLDKGAIRNWANDQKRAVGKTVRAFRTAATTQADGFRSETALAGSTAAGQVRDWALKQTGQTQGFFAQLYQMFLDWSAQAQTESDLWAEQRAGEARDATISNVNTLQAFVSTQGETVDLDTNEAYKTLSKEQQEVIKAYYAAPAGARDALGAVAAGLRYRIGAEERGQLIEKLRADVLAKPYSEADNLEQIVQAEISGFSASKIADNLYNAMFGGVTGWGTDEKNIFDNLTGLTPLAGYTVRATYSNDHGRNLDSDLDSELSDGELVRAQGGLNGDVVTEAVGALYDAMHGGITGLGTDEDLIMKMLRGKSDAEREMIVTEYKRRYNIDLNADLKDEMSSHDLERSQALMEGNTARADAIGLDQAMHGGIFGLGTDEGQIDSVYANIRGDVAGMQVAGKDGKMRPMTQEEMEAEVARRNMDVEASYDARYGSPGDQESALRAAYKDELSGPDLDLANALADNDLIAADAARLEQEKRGIFYADDKVINGVLENQYGRALDGLKRDPAWRDRRDAIQEKARKEGWSPYRLAAAERAIDREMEEAAKAGGAANMAALENKYDTKYSRWGKGGLDAMIVFNMSGTDREKAQALRKQGGHLSRAQRVDFASRGAGTDEEDFTRATEGLTKAEIEDLNRDLARLGRPTVQEIADDELDGRENFDMKITLRGVPENIDEDMQQSQLRTDWELTNSPIGGHERDVMQARLAKMRRQYDLMRDPTTPKAERDRALAQFRSRGVGVQSSVEQFRAQVDAVTDAVATVAALTVAIAVTVATGGVAGAVLGALYAAMTTIAVKAALKGAAYGTDEMAVDAIVGIVDAAAAAATAGVGNALMRVAAAQGKRVGGLASTKLAAVLARMAQSSSRTQRMLAHGVAEGIEGAAGALPSALAGNMLNDQNWEHGNPFTNIVGGTLVETGFGFALGGGLGSLGGIKMPKPQGAAPPHNAFDLLANRGTPKDRLSAWKTHKAENPDAHMSDFLRMWDDAATSRLAKQAGDAKLQRAMRTELMAGLPPGDRKALAGFKVEIMSEADFRAFTRSDSAMAVTIIDNGTPKVILRDGAPLSVLREEGIHLGQLADPDLGPMVKRLDEARLGKWDKMSLADRMELYAVKVDLEIDAQHKLIASLKADLKAGRAGDPAGLAKQLAAAEGALGNLQHRAAEVGRIGPLDRIAMARGLRDPPGWLDQPARLFNKNSKAVTLGPVLTDSPFPNHQKHKGAGLVAHEVLPPPPKRLSTITLDAKSGFTLKLAAGPTEFKVIRGELRMKKGTRWVATPSGLITDLDGIIPPFQHNGGLTVHVERPYRKVALVDPANPGTIIDLREEALKLDHKTMQTGTWAESGPSIAGKGSAAEVLSHDLSALKAATPGDPVIASFKVQNPDGTGFDGVEIRLGPDGKPVLTVVEVKDYGGYVNYDKFTAVSTNKGNPPGNLIENLQDLRDKLTPTQADRFAARTKAAASEGNPFNDTDFLSNLQTDGYMDAMAKAGDVNANAIAEESDRILAETMAQKLGLSPENYLLARAAMDARNIELLIRVTPNTDLGVQGVRSLMNRIKADWQGLEGGPFLKSMRAVRTEDLLPNAIRDATAATKALGIDLRYTKLAGAPFADAKGNLFAVEQAANLVGPAQIDQMADRLAQKLTNAVILPDGTHGKLGLIIDLSDHQEDRVQLQTALMSAIEAALLRRSQPVAALNRVTILTTRR